ncbi:hypothetical protein AB4Z45_22390 [Paenibacillus sp. MCAF9]|uniref:hypothetical protein n=1 Tax=Paenibacillus sp. MCAF9 TaxID=3233046 RepID=UPI003F96BB1E
MMQGFKSSINLQFDLDDYNVLNRYILSSSHAEAFRGIFESLLTERGMHSHLLIGPYGTGKSLLASIVCQLLSKQVPKDLFERFYEQVKQYDAQLADMLLKINNNKIVYIPVVINGKTGNLRKIINSAIYRSIHEADIGISTPNEITTIINKIDLWKTSYSGTYTKFLEHIKKLNLKENEWKQLIKGYDEQLISEFKSFYPSVTSGSALVTDQEEEFIENIQFILGELNKKNIGLQIVYDEFGRFLQSAQSLESQQNMQDLQDLAELSNSYSNIQLLIIGHKNIRQYAVQSKENIRLEFEKVEKRFRTYSFETDPNTYLQLAYEAASPINQRTLNEKKELESVDDLQSYSLFNDFTPFQLNNYVINGMYPLHPAAVTLLPHLSSILGQNERTLFSFFEDEERYGLINHAEYEKGYYHADKLFYYFVNDNQENKELAALKLYQKVIQYISLNKPIQLRIVQLITLWSVTNLTAKQLLSTNFISFALGVNIELVDENLKQLSYQKVIRFNQILNQWELFEGSSVDVEQEINERLITTILSKKEKIAILEQHLTLQHVLPYEYNDQMSMLRYAQIEFVWLADLQDVMLTSDYIDDRIFFVLIEHEDLFDSTQQLIKENISDYIVALPNFTSDEIEISLKRHEIITQMIKDPVFLSIDSRLKNELQFIKQEINNSIQSYVNKYLLFSELNWWLAGNNIKIKGIREIENIVSNRMIRKYPNTPEIRNESFNRRKITAVQRRAAIDVIDRLIQSPYQPNLGIEGYGANYLIYASVLKNNGYQMSLDQGIICHGNLGVLRLALQAELLRKPNGRVSDLVKLFLLPPFGIRSSVIPVLFVSLLRDVWEKIMFYAHDMHASHLNGTVIYELIERSAEYEYKFFNISLDEQNKLIHIGGLFGLEPNECSNILYVTEAMLKWLRSLPKFAQITYQLSDVTINSRNLIKSAEVDPYRLINELTTGDFSLLQAKEELEDFIETNLSILIEKLLSITGCNNIDEFLVHISSDNVEVVGMNSKFLTLPQLSNDASDLMKLLIHHMVGVERTEWSDATQELFLNQFTHEWQVLQASKEFATGNEEQVALETIQLSKKSQLLYTNVKNILKYAGKDISNQEIKFLLMKLMQEV